MNVGYDQNKVFQEGGDEPFWMTLQERVAINSINYDEPSLKYKTKDYLLDYLKTAGLDMSIVKENISGELQDISCQNLTSTTNRIIKESVKVWMGNPKVLLQVLWEHVFMEISKDVCT